MLLGIIGFIVLGATGGMVLAVGAAAIGFAAFTIGVIKAITGWHLADDLGGATNISPLNPISSPKDRELD